MKVGGTDVRAYDTEVLRDQVSVVLQKNTLFSGSILDNLRWGNPDATDQECIEACKAACADEFIDRFPDGYHTHIERGGQQRLRRPEATAVHCPGPAEKAQGAHPGRLHLRRGHRHRRQDPAGLAEQIPGTTKIIIAQRISSVQDADRILVLDNGRVNAFDTHENLLKSNPHLPGDLRVSGQGAAATSTSPRERRKCHAKRQTGQRQGRAGPRPELYASLLNIPLFWSSAASWCQPCVP